MVTTTEFSAACIKPWRHNNGCHVQHALTPCISMAAWSAAFSVESWGSTNHFSVSFASEGLHGRVGDNTWHVTSGKYSSLPHIVTNYGLVQACRVPGKVSEKIILGVKMTTFSQATDKTDVNLCNITSKHISPHTWLHKGNESQSTAGKSCL